MTSNPYYSRLHNTQQVRPKPDHPVEHLLMPVLSPINSPVLSTKAEKKTIDKERITFNTSEKLVQHYLKKPN